MLLRLVIAVTACWIFLALNTLPVLAVEPDFSNKRIFGTGVDQTYSIALGDLDGDGDMDIVAGNMQQQDVLYLNDGSGHFANSRSLETEVSTTYVVAVGDMDGDGDLDIVTGDYRQNKLLLNDGLGNFANVHSFGINGYWTTAMALGDLDGDGDLDIITGGELGGYVYLNDGNGSFNESHYFGFGFGFWTPTFHGLAIGDMDNDGDLDIVASNEFGSESFVFLNDGAANFTSSHGFTYTSDGTKQVVVGDMNADGSLDIVTHSTVYLNDGTGNFPTLSSFGNLSTPRSVAAGDLDSDGDLDVVVDTARQRMFYLNDGAGHFTLGSSFGTGEYITSSIMIGEMNGDGHVDIVTGNFEMQDIVFLNDGAGDYTSFRAVGSGADSIECVTVGDLDGDDSLDVIVGANGQHVVYLNSGANIFTPARNLMPKSDYATDVAVGDMDGDGDLDIIGGNYYDQSIVYLNDGNGNFTSARPFGTYDSFTLSVAVGDMDGDSDLDVVTGGTGGTGHNFVHFNDGTGNLVTSRDFGIELATMASVAVGDMDGDSDLDVVAADVGETVIYLNDGTGNFATAWRFGIVPGHAAVVALGDVDSDGDLDIINGISGAQNLVQMNDGNGNFARVKIIGQGTSTTIDVATGDIDGDGDLDILTGSTEQDKIYLNDGTGDFTVARNLGKSSGSGGSAVFGDMDGDGDLDVIIGSYPQQSIYMNDGTAEWPVWAFIDSPSPTKSANFYSTPWYLSDRTIELPYTLFATNSNVVGGISVQYSMNGGGYWLNAVPTLGTQTTHLAASPSGAEHLFTWDTFATGFFGQSDNVLLRLVVYAQPSQPAAHGTYRYVNSTAGSFQRAYFATQTFPFRVRGTQVRTLQNSQTQSSVIVYRLPAGDERSGQLIGGESGPYRTNSAGYLSGAGQLGIGDRLLALLPISHTASYDVYYTSPVDPSTGLPGYTVSQAGVQTLTVYNDNALILFNLDVALEWDASKDAAYVAKLQYDLNRTSELLYDWSNGQAALGRIRIFHDARRQPEVNGFQPWLNSHIRIYASNAVHPNAIQGGIVGDRTVETMPGGKQVTYTPGMVHIGSVWNRYADSSTLGEDWPRALAHELGHYLFFLDDNYIGQAPDGSVQFISSDPNTGCPGAMNDPYTDFLAKYQPQPSWLPGCANTYSQQTLGRSDWETIVAHYPWLHAPAVPIQQVNPGPSGQRLAFTQFEVVPPPDAVADRQTLAVPIFTISTADGSAYQPSSGARAFLFQDQRLVELGTPSLDQLVAHGARNGDTVCLLEPDSQRAGCVTAAIGVDQLVVQPVADWQPQVIFSPVTSRTLTVRVEGIAAGLSLKAQLYPRDGDASVVLDLTPVGSGYGGTFSLPEPVFEGSLRVWDANNPLRQVITDFVLGSNPTRWDSRDARWRARLARWRARLVPIISSGGKVAVLGENVDFGSEDWVFSLQAATALPDLPTWATPVGQGYWLHATANAPDLSGTAISFNYNSRDVPAGQESALRVFFWDGSSWAQLTTNINTDQRISSAPTQGAGIYTLVAALEIPLQGPGWNNFAYAVVGEPTPVSQALGSIAGLYSIVYSYEPTNPIDPWRAFDPSAPYWVNDLKFLEYGKSYWIYATQPAILHPTATGSQLGAAGTSANTGGLNPPAVVYGTVEPAQNFSPQPGMAVTAWIDGTQCGQAQTQAFNGAIVYVIDVTADASVPGCGAAGRTTDFRVADREMPAEAIWDNTRATKVVLGPAAGGALYLPSLHR